MNDKPMRPRTKRRIAAAVAGLPVLIVVGVVIADQLLWADGKLWNVTKSDRPSISGQVRDIDGVGIPDIMLRFINIDGTDLGWAVTDEVGLYIRYVPYGWSGTVVPQRHPYYETPTTQPG